MSKFAKIIPKFVLAALIAALGFSTSVLAQAPGEGPDGGSGWHHGHHGHGGVFGHELRQLDLTGAQMASIKQILQAARPQIREQMLALHTQRAAFDTAVPGSSAYQAAASSLAQAQASAASERVQEEASIRTQIYALLTSAQQAQLATLIAQREAKIAQWQAQQLAPAAQ